MTKQQDNTQAGQPGQGQQHGGQSRPRPDQGDPRQQGDNDRKPQRQPQQEIKLPGEGQDPAMAPDGTPDIEDPNEAIDEADNNRVV